jgi:antitoxin component YwqK of YwqJK toxin-antitoxin module
MKKLSIILFSFLAGCSSDPVNMDEVLFERGGQYITNDNFHSFFYFNQKVYNGPGFTLHRNGKKKEAGALKNGFQSGAWNAWDDKGNKRFSGGYEHGREHGKWTGFYASGKKKYEGVYEYGHQAGKWLYFDNAGNKNLEEVYYSCTKACEASHFKHTCPKKGQINESENF